MFQTYFSAPQVINLIISLFLLFSVLFVFHRKRGNDTVLYIALFLFALSLGIFSITMDPFLHSWDERFHIQVAKNLWGNMLQPMLYRERVIVPDDTYGWGACHIWLHKQPFFTWLMSISHGIFGDSEWCYRLPGALLVCFTTVSIYRSGVLLFNRQVGLVAALFSCTAYFLHMLVSGTEGMDHNDVAFYCFITLSLWAFAEWVHRPVLGWAILTGALAGIAVLNKWLVGLWVFEGFLLYIIFNKTFRLHIGHLLLAAITAFVVFMPWQIYAALHWPEQFAFEMQYNVLHFNEVIEEHQGDWNFYFQQWQNLYGGLLSLAIVPGLLLLFLRMRNRALAFSLLIMLVTLYLFFIIAETKVRTFVYPASVFIYMGIAVLWFEVMERIKLLSRPYIFYPLLAFALLLNFKLHAVEMEYGKQNNGHWLINNKAIFMKMKEELPANTVLFNVRTFNIDAMFYTGFTTYAYFPDMAQVQQVLQKHKTLVVAVEPDYIIPDSLKKIEGLLFYRCNLNHF